MIQDGLNQWSAETFHVLSGSGNQSFSDSGALSLSLSLNPGVLYSVDLLGHLDPVVEIPEPGTWLLLGCGLLGLCAARRMAKTQRSKAKPCAPVELRSCVVSGIAFGIVLWLSLFAVPQAWAIPEKPADTPVQIHCSSCSCSNKTNACTFDKPYYSKISYSEGLFEETMDLPNFGTSLSLSLTYRSHNADASNYRFETVLGLGWTHSFDLFVTEYRGDAYIHRGDGTTSKFKLNPDGSYTVLEGWYDTLQKPDANTFLMTTKEGAVYRFEKLNPAPFLMPGPPYYVTRITDRNGLHIDLAYNAQSRIDHITDEYGRVTTFTYNAKKKIATITDPLGRVTRLNYDPNGYDLRQVIDTENKSTQYTYNSNHQITRKKDRAGKTFDYIYSGTKPIAVKDSTGQFIKRYANANNWALNNQALLIDTRRLYVPGTTRKTDGEGRVWLYDYDKNGFITKITPPAPNSGNTVEFTYDAQTLQVALRTEANPGGPLHRTEYAYDSRGNMTLERRYLEYPTVDPAKIFDTLYEYEPVFSKITQITYPNGSITQYQYDANGNRKLEIRDLGGLNLSTEWTYYTPGAAVPENPSGAGGLVQSEIVHNGANL